MRVHELIQYHVDFYYYICPTLMRFWMVYTGDLDDFIYSSDVYSEFMVIKLLRVSFKNPSVRTVKISLYF